MKDTKINLIGIIHGDIFSRGRIENCLKFIKPDLITTDYNPALVDRFENEIKEKKEELENTINSTNYNEDQKKYLKNQLIEKYDVTSYEVSKEYSLKNKAEVYNLESSSNQVMRKQGDRYINWIMEKFEETNDRIKNGIFHPKDLHFRAINMKGLDKLFNILNENVEDIYSLFLNNYYGLEKLDKKIIQDYVRGLTKGSIGQRDFEIANNLKDILSKNNYKRIVHFGGVTNFINLKGTTYFNLKTLNPERYLLNQFDFSNFEHPN